MNAILGLILNVLWLYTIVIFAMVIMSWLIAFNVVNLHNNFVAQLWYILNRLTEPLLGPIRRILPNMGGIDLSPIVLLLAVYFLQTFIARDLSSARSNASFACRNGRVCVRSGFASMRPFAMRETATGNSS